MEKLSSEKQIGFQEAAAHANYLRTQGKTIVFTNGCFDIIHAGHVHYLSEASTHGDVLWIGLNTDDSVRRLKGIHRPINHELARQFVLSHLEPVSFVTLFNDDTPVELISKIKPDVHIKGGDYKKEDLIEYPLVRQYGGTVIIKPFLDGFSTTSIIKSAIAGHEST